MPTQHSNTSEEPWLTTREPVISSSLSFRSSSLRVEPRCTIGSALRCSLHFPVISGELLVSKKNSALICPGVINQPTDHPWFLRHNFQITWLSWVLIVERCFCFGMTSFELPNNHSFIHRRYKFCVFYSFLCVPAYSSRWQHDAPKNGDNPGHI